jgi:hypothetical protein
MEQFSNRSKIHKRLSSFVDWIAPEKATRDDIKVQSDKIRENIKAEAVKDGLTIKSMPYAGSFQKKTGLRRHYRGHSEVDGQDIDIPFIVNPKDSKGNEITELLNRFYRYVNNVYPNKDKTKTKSSIDLCMTNILSFDIVPLLATNVEDKQILIRSDGERRPTSVLKHTEFIKNRNKKSKELPGRVSFNECVRLVKWWRYFRQEESGIFDNEDKCVPSFLIDLLCAKAYDTCSVQETYSHTIAHWFGYLGHLIANKQPVIFTDNYSNGEKDPSSLWTVLDPVTNTNNIVKKWNNMEISELAGWFNNSHDDFNRAIAKDLNNDDSGSMDELVKIFGNPFKNNVE